ncbi:MerC mercury resistance protein [Aureliella helgolandensis]|uniref:MerC mercury resistance protein n=2 Tax=Aureliella helgolandensis TaxID=2527968 RepID=A0A518G3R3_9BACT|nr:MerC mercury resistance protein [Aureliella helgolandensis]
MPTADLSTNRQGGWQDWLGITASVACAVHCAAMPFVIGFLPMFGLQFLSHESFHATMAILCFAIAIIAFLPGWRQHRRMIPAAIAGAGITVIGFAAFAMDDCCASCVALPTQDAHTTNAATSHETVNCSASCCACCPSETTADAAMSSGEDASDLAPWYQAGLTPLGGLLLVSAHLYNRRLLCQCACCKA